MTFIRWKIGASPDQTSQFCVRMLLWLRRQSELEKISVWRTIQSWGFREARRALWWIFLSSREIFICKRISMKLKIVRKGSRAQELGSRANFRGIRPATRKVLNPKLIRWRHKPSKSENYKMKTKSCMPRQWSTKPLPKRTKWPIKNKEKLEEWRTCLRKMLKSSDSRGKQQNLRRNFKASKLKIQC